MISYAQNYEDVTLSKAFSERPDGFYIDIGAYHPQDLSVTRHFYDLGWHGINVEPIPELHAGFKRDRPRDINVNKAISATSDRRELQVMYDQRGVLTGLSTMSDQESDARQREGFEARRIDVECVSLDRLFAEHVGDRTVDFLKIDVEGGEREVIDSCDWQRNRPRVLLLEAVRPNRPDLPAHQDWESVLLAAGYQYVLFDGLNRFYVRGEDAALAPLLQRPMNLFDDVIRHAHQQRIEKLERRLRESGDLLGPFRRLGRHVRRAMTSRRAS